MADKLPSGWIRTKLGDVCLPVANVQPAETPTTEYTYFDIGGIDNTLNRVAEIKRIIGRTAPSRARQVVRKGDILFSNVRTYLRKIALIEEDYSNPIASTGFTVIRSPSEILPEFLFYQILSDRFLQPIHALQTGTSYPAVRPKDVLARSVLIAPISEQKRIVEKLKVVLSRIEAGQKAATRALQQLHEHRAVILRLAMTGELTRKWRRTNKTSESGTALLKRLVAERRAHWEKAELNRLRQKDQLSKNDNWKRRYQEPVPPNISGLPKLSRGWTWASVDQLAWNSSYGTSIKCTYQARGPAVLRIPNLQDGLLDFSDLKFASTIKTWTRESFVSRGDFLLIRTNGSKKLVGRAAIVKNTPKRKCSFASYLIRFRLSGELKFWSWMAFAWDSPLVRAQIEAKALTTAGQYNVAVSRLSKHRYPLTTHRNVNSSV